MEIAKAQEGGSYTVVYRSKPIMKTLDPRSVQCEIPLAESQVSLLLLLDGHSSLCLFRDSAVETGTELLESQFGTGTSECLGL